MAAPKERLTVVARDPEFSKKLRAPAARKSPFMLRDTLEDEPVAPPDALTPQTPSDNRPEAETPAPKIEPETSAPSQNPPSAADQSARKQQAAGRSPVKNVEAAPEETAVIRVSFRVADDLVQRASQLAKLAKCPPQRVLLVAFNELRETLLDKVATIQEGDIPDDRHVDATGRVDTSLTIPVATKLLLEQRLDPQGFNGMNRLLSRWARGEFMEFLDDYLTKKGY